MIGNIQVRETETAVQSDGDAHGQLCSGQQSGRISVQSKNVRTCEVMTFAVLERLQKKLKDIHVHNLGYDGANKG